MVVFKCWNNLCLIKRYEYQEINKLSNDQEPSRKSRNARDIASKVNLDMGAHEHRCYNSSGCRRNAQMATYGLTNLWDTSLTCGCLRGVLESIGRLVNMLDKRQILSWQDNPCEQTNKQAMIAPNELQAKYVTWNYTEYNLRCYNMKN